MRRLRHLLEYFLVRALLFLVDRLPLRLCRRLADAGADLAFLLHASRRRVAVDNLLAAGLAPDRRGARRIARASFRHFARLVVVSLKSDAFFRERPWPDGVEWRASPELLRMLDDPAQGLILACGHLGHWEIAAQLISRRKPVVGITRKMNNPLVDRLMQRRKPRHRFELTPKHDANIGRLAASLRQGKVLAIMIDQHARDRGMDVDFFGRPAATHTALALLHLVTKTPLCFGYCTETAPMTFRLHAAGPFRFQPTGDKEGDVRRILEAMTRELEAAVRAHPEEYLWGHRRWRGPEPSARRGRDEPSSPGKEARPD